MILSKKPRGTQDGQVDHQNFNSSIANTPPIANSTVMNNTTNMYLNETDQFFSDPFYNNQNGHNHQQNVQPQANYYKPSAQPNGAYDYQSNGNFNPGFNPNANNHNNVNQDKGNMGYNGQPAYQQQQQQQNQKQQQQQFYNGNSNMSNQPFNYQQEAPFQPHQTSPFQQQAPQQPFQQAMFNGLQPNNIFNDPVASMAVKYGSTLADQGKEYVAQNVDKWFSISKLKYYFAVDTNYVAKKLLIILFPFINRDWSIKYSQNDDSIAVPPKLDVNAPDMYIPTMAFVTYLLIVGVAMGMQKKFSPEMLGIQASSALGWYIFEVFIIFLSLQILSIKSALKTFDIVAFSGYKYFGMIVCLLAGIFASKNGYYIVLLYICVTFTYFMARTLKLMILTSSGQAAAPNGQPVNPYENSVHGNKRRIYVLLFISLLQPLLIWWLTFGVTI